MEQAWEPSSSQERMVAASSKRFILTKEMNHFYEQLMVVVSRSGFDFTPGSATRLWLWGGAVGAVHWCSLHRWQQPSPALTA